MDEPRTLSADQNSTEDLSLEDLEAFARPAIPIRDYVRRQRLIDMSYCPNHLTDLVTLVLQANTADDLRELRCPSCDFVYRERELADHVASAQVVQDDALHDR